jgi:16S rRNA (guanine527-N7)-methyltransferase
VADTDNGEQSPSALLHALSEAREAGFLGPGPIERHLIHAEGFVALARHQEPAPPGKPLLLDLGSGGGLPGLVVADQWPEATLVLLDAMRRRTEFLQRMVEDCGFEDRVTVVQGRAELYGRDPAYRGMFDGVVVRSFGPPAVVAECAAPFLRSGGWLIVSEPPTAASGSEDSSGVAEAVTDAERADGGSRWPAVELAQFGLEPIEFVRLEFGYQILRQRERCPDRFPRRDGVPARKPLF